MSKHHAETMYYGNLIGYDRVHLERRIHARDSLSVIFNEAVSCIYNDTAYIQLSNITIEVVKSKLILTIHI